jgi:hypothetical protein
MKSLFLKTQTLAYLLLGFVVVFAQNSMKIPQNTAFYMEINGKQLNKKIDWERFNPFLQEITKEKGKDKKPSWNDYSKTGIKYDATQYHYGTFNDSVQSYNAHFIIDNQEKFQEFINSTKKKGLEVSKKSNYSYIDIDDNTFVAWNGNRAYLTMINYNKPSKDTWADYNAADSTTVIIDSAVAVVDSAAAVYEEEKPFDYKEEIQYLKDEIKYLKENIKSNNADILKYQKDIKYLQKHRKYPAEKVETKDDEKDYDEIAPPASQDDYAEAEAYPLDTDYQKELDSLQSEKFKIVKKFAENNFDRYFSSNYELDVPKEMLNFRDANSDVFVYTDYGKIMNEGIYGKMFRRVGYTKFLEKMYNSNSAYNLYFDKDKVRLVNNIQHRNSDIQKSISDVYRGKKNKKLTALISDKSVGYYAMNVNGYKTFDMMYSFFQDAGEKEYQKELQLMMETMKIVLDEEAIAKIAPGNGIFVLNELKSKKVDYTDYDYDDDYNEKEVKKTKDVMVPDFTFAFATENEGYWKRVFDVLTTNKDFAKKFTKNGDIYTFKESKSNGYLDQLYFTVKDGIVYLTSSTENLNAKNQSSNSTKWMKDSAKYPLSGRLDIQKLLVGLEQEFKTVSEKKTLNSIRKNVGEVYFKTEVKGGSIQTEMDYNIKNSSENSLMYFFDLFDEIFKNMEADKKPQTL